MKFQEKPEYWPTKQPWPLPRGVFIVAIKELLPPIYVLNNGKEIKGTRRCTILTKKKARCKRRAVDGEHYCALHGAKKYISSSYI